MRNWNWLVCLSVLAAISVGCSKKGEPAISGASPASENTVAEDGAAKTVQENAEKPAESKSILDSVKGYFSKKEETPAEEPKATVDAPAENTPAADTDVAVQPTPQPAEPAAETQVPEAVDTSIVAQAIEEIKQATKTSTPEPAPTVSEEPGILRTTLDRLRFKDRWSFLWWGIIWFLFSIPGQFVLDAHNPFKKDQKARIAKAKARHQFGAFGLMIVPIVLAFLANMDRVPWGWGWTYLVAVVAVYFIVVMGLWSMIIRWAIYVYETYSSPYNHTAEEFLKDLNAPIKYNGYFIFRAVEIPDQSSKSGEFHPELLTEPYVTVSRHTALPINRI